MYDDYTNVSCLDDLDEDTRAEMEIHEILRLQDEIGDVLCAKPGTLLGLIATARQKRADADRQQTSLYLRLSCDAADWQLADYILGLCTDHVYERINDKLAAGYDGEEFDDTEQQDRISRAKDMIAEAR